MINYLLIAIILSILICSYKEPYGPIKGTEMKPISVCEAECKFRFDERNKNYGSASKERYQSCITACSMNPYSMSNYKL